MASVQPVDRVAVCAAGEAVLMGALYRGLGHAWTSGPGIAWAPTVPHRFLLGAVTLTRRPPIPIGIHGPVRDSWAALTGAMPDGWLATHAGVWMHRPSGTCRVVTPVGVSVTACLDAELFERTVFLAAGGVTPDRPGVLHPRGSERVPGLHLYVAFAGARAVGTALAVVHSHAVHVSAVAVLPQERGRGIGAALAATALNTQPCMPATLTASFVSAPIYRRLGFEPVGEPLDWKPVANLSPAEKDVSHT